MKYPRISLRVSDELKAACEQAGPDAVRAALSVLLSDKPTDQPLSDKLLSDNDPKLSDKPKVKRVSDKVKARVVRQLSDKPTEDPGGVPAWLAKLNADRDRIAQEKERKDAERRAAEAVKLGTA